jgi:hypothetical protein
MNIWEKCRNVMIEYDKPLDAMGCFPYVRNKRSFTGELANGGSNGHAKGSWAMGMWVNNLGSFLPARSFTNQI